MNHLWNITWVGDNFRLRADRGSRHGGEAVQSAMDALHREFGFVSHWQYCRMVVENSEGGE
jgi:hypothetical protein